MPFYTGTAADLATLLTAARSALQTEGWALDGDVLHKGDCFVELVVSGSTLQLLGGTGIDGSNALTGAGPFRVRIRAFEQPLVFPLTYFLHINESPDEVYLYVRYAVDFYQCLAWGVSDVVGVPGSGVWYHGTQGENSATDLTLGYGSGGTGHRPMFFGGVGLPASESVDNRMSSFIFDDFDGTGWRTPTLPFTSVWELLSRQPNAWNSHTVLIPIQVWCTRPSNTASLGADIRHARYVRIDNLNPEDVVTLGSEKWRVYPIYRKDTNNRDGGAMLQHSGTFGLALRYDGGE